MYIMADLADEQGIAYTEERQLVAIKVRATLNAAWTWPSPVLHTYAPANLVPTSDSPQPSPPKAFPDGSFDMKPGFSKPGLKYRFEDSAGVDECGLRESETLRSIHYIPSIVSYFCVYAGGIYEYTVENASQTAEPNLEKRTAKLQKAVAKRAEEVRRNFLRLEFTPPPGVKGC